MRPFLPRLTALLFVVLPPPCAPAKGAHAQSVSTFNVETHLIDTTLTVRDAQGHPVRGLTQNQFVIVEDGVPQNIRFFAQGTELPLSIGLVIDVSGSQEKFVKEHEKDIEAFLNHALQPGDQAFAVCFGNHLRLVSDFTASGAAIIAGIHNFNKGKRDGPELGPAEERELGTALYDAVFYSVTEKLLPIHRRRKVIVVFSDGEENSSEHDLLDSIQAAQDADVIVYSIRYTDLHHGSLRARDRYGMRVLDHLSTQTGGKTFDAHATNLDQAFAEIAGDLRSFYELAYQSTRPVRDGAFRKVVIETTVPGVTVRARAGYYAR